MSEPINDGGLAFPTSHPDCIADCGMTLRDYFAGQALTGYTSTAKSRALLCSEVAEHAYDYADAMLAKRKEDGK